MSGSLKPFLAVTQRRPNALMVLSDWRVLVVSLAVSLMAVVVVVWRSDENFRQWRNRQQSNSAPQTLSELKLRHGGDLKAALATMTSETGWNDDGELIELNLDYSAVTDDDLALLGEFQQLRALSLAGTGISDRGLLHLAKLYNLQTLVLYYTSVSDEGLQNLHGCRNLRVVNLYATHVTGQGVKSLKDLPNLEVAILETLPIDDHQLGDLKELKQLTSLSLLGTRISEAGFAELRAALPQCVIYGP